MGIFFDLQTWDVNLAIEASTNTQSSYKAATLITQESPNKEQVVKNRW